ncbi:hypothetical protein [Sinomonas sp. ASV322]|uniref:hypothetical protein n=1 Tax=Sinomonas sp. ASV322 TaxID=3041920 RepID=UPI0027DBFF52|nr:hypothetical protein [Sinomonas sp. ASV322]MDQ4502260.1 hypothetical protein [Sinomonas sp. ASV322]
MSAPSPFAEVFVSTHAGALQRASALDSGSASSLDGEAVRIPGVSDYEIEQLGSLVGTAVHAGGADYELSMVDVSSDSLLAVPPAMIRALAELLAYESDEGEGDAVERVAAAWVDQEDLPFDAQEAYRYVEQLAKLAADVDDSDRQELFVWAGS